MHLTNTGIALPEEMIPSMSARGRLLEVLNMRICMKAALQLQWQHKAAEVSSTLLHCGTYLGTNTLIPPTVKIKK